MTHCLGRLPRIRLPHVPHLSALLAGRDLPPPPPEVDYTRGLPKDLGAMLNDSLGDCTCAAFYHALQVWSANANPPMVTQPDTDVLSLYVQACGYKPGDGSTDQGGAEQSVLSYLLNTGAPVGPGGTQRHKLAAFVEVDPRNLDDVKRTIADCGVAYIGFNVPSFLTNGLTAPNSDWDTQPGPDDIVGGHAVILAGYRYGRFVVISWGNQYTMTERFFAKYVDEVYALADQQWIEATGKNPFGLTLDQQEATMQAIKEGAPA